MGSYSQTNGGSTSVSTGGKGTSMSVGPMYPGYTGYQQSPWLGILSGLLQRQQMQQQPAFRYQAPTYAQMQQQANPNGWQAPPPVYVPPPPVAAPPPPAATPAYQPYDVGPRLGQDANATTGGGGGAFARGGVVQPTEAQKHAGNYKKDHITFHGLPIAVETPKGSAREGKDANGKSWRCVMPADYGYIKRTEGADGDHVDVYVGPDRDSKMVFLINQNDHQTGKFDEHKVMLGYSSERAAVADYVKAFSDGKGPDRIRSVEPMSLDGFKQWLKLGKTKTPAKAKSIVEHALAVVRSKK